MISQRHIYLISNMDTRWIKVGISKNPHRRVRKLQTGNPNALMLMSHQPDRCTLRSAGGAERVIHWALGGFGFEQSRRSGEWFESPRDVDWRDRFWFKLLDGGLNEPDCDKIGRQVADWCKEKPAPRDCAVRAVL